MHLHRQRQAMQSPHSSPNRLHLALLLAVLFVVYVFEINHGLPNRDIVWGYDANPLIPLIAAKRIFLDGWNTGWHSPYPNFHYYVLLLFLTPYMAMQWLLGNLAGLRMEGGYPYGLMDFDTIFMHLAIITRAVSVAMALGIAYWVYAIGRALHSRRAGLLAALIAGFSPAVVYYVHIETLDVPMLFWLAAAMYCYVRVLQSFELRFYVGLAALAAVATATKDYAYGAFVLMPVPLILALARHVSGSLNPSSLVRSALDRRHAVALLAFVVAFALAENWVWNFSGFVNHVKLAGGFVPPPGGGVITTSFGRLDFFSFQRLDSAFQAMTFILGWAGAAICVAGILYAIRHENRIIGILVWPAVSYYIFTVCQTVPAETSIERPYMPLGIMLAIPGGILLARASESPRIVFRILLVGAIFAIASNGIAMVLAMVTDPRYQAERFLKQRVTAGSKVELYGLRSELPRTDSNWNSMIFNVFPKPLSDVQITAANVAPESLANRNPDWIVVPETYFLANSATHDAEVPPALQAFLRKLSNGDLNYTREAQFVSKVSDVFRFPPRLTPRVTVFARKPNPPGFCLK